MEQKTLRLFLWKNFIYTLLILLAYLLQETPALFPVALRPVLVISMVTAIAMNEGEFSGGLFGLFGGLLCDPAVFHIFGAASIFFLVLGCGCGLLIIYLIQPTVRSAFLLSGSFALIYGLAAHYLIYGMWGYECGPSAVHPNLPIRRINRRFRDGLLLAGLENSSRL